MSKNNSISLRFLLFFGISLFTLESYSTRAKAQPEISGTASIRLTPQARIRVLIVSTSIQSTLTQKLQFEFMTNGFDVVVLPTPLNATENTDLPTLARLHQSRILLRTAEASSSVEVWLTDEQYQSLKFVGITSALPQDGGDLRLVAIRTLETTRAGLFPVQYSAPVQRAASPPKTTNEAIVPNKYSLAFGPSLFGSNPFNIGIRLEAGWKPFQRFAFSFLTDLPFGSIGYTVPEGTVTIHSVLFGGSALYFPFSPESIFQPHIGAGLSVLFARVSGDAKPPYISGNESIWSAMPFLRAGVGFRISRYTRTFLDGILGVALPKGEAAVLGKPIASWGSPLLSMNLSFEVSWPG